MGKLKLPLYSNIFQPETSFRTQIVDLENEDKKICLKRTLRLNLSNPISFHLLFYTFILLIFNNLQANVRIRDFLCLLCISLRKKNLVCFLFEKISRHPISIQSGWNKEKRVVINNCFTAL